MILPALVMEWKKGIQQPPTAAPGSVSRKYRKAIIAVSVVSGKVSRKYRLNNTTTFDTTWLISQIREK